MNPGTLQAAGPLRDFSIQTHKKTSTRQRTCVELRSLNGQLFRSAQIEDARPPYDPEPHTP